MQIFRKNIMCKVKNVFLLLANPQVVFYTMIWLMVLLFVGTIAQKYIGLYAAQSMFFSSWILWLGYVPLPSGMPAMGLLTLALMAKLFLASRWNLQNSGIIITHIGALLLLIGGLVTYLHAQEGNMVIYEGERTNLVSDYHINEFVIFESDTKRNIISFNWEELEKGLILPVSDLPVRVEIVKLCKNCDIFIREELGDNSEFRGMAQRMDISPLPLENINEENRGALQFRVSGASDDVDGVYFTADFIDASPQIEVDGIKYNIALRKKQTILPFEIELIDFEKRVYPATNKPKSYKSEVILYENGAEWRSIIQMNEPLRYRGYTFYQSSFIQNGEQEATVFAVVKNAGRMFPYIASIVMCIGLLVHVILRLPKLMKSRAVKVALFLIATTMSMVMPMASPSQAKTTIYEYDFTEFSHIPILDQGRVKPLDAFARTYLEIIYGRDYLPDKSAIEWLVEVIFNPERAYRREIFNISNPDVVDFLDLERRKGHRYSYKEVTTSFSANSKIWASLFTMDESDMSLPQKQLLELYGKIDLFAGLSRSLSLLFPDLVIPEGELSKALDVEPETTVSFFKLRPHQNLIEKMSKELQEKANDKNYIISKQDLILGQLVSNINELNRHQNSNIFKIIPPFWKGNSNKDSADLWFSPWGIGAYGQGSPDSAKFMNMWGELIKAYRAGDVDRWNGLVFDINMVNKIDLRKMLSLEANFNKADPFMISFVFYLSAFLVVMASFMLWSKGLRKLAFAFIIAGLAFHVAGLGIRMFIMQRPPVTNLYDSIIFVSLITGLFGAFLEWRLKNTLGIIIAASMGAFLHLIAMKFDAEGDTMGMLAAVLDTNFWLATHVVTITIGYGVCLVGGVLGHIYLIRRIIKPNDRKNLSELFRIMRGVLLIALLFTALGTILGGIWADQSWGRFWGWDPKENGALLIVLWLIMLIHGYFGKNIGELGFAVGMVCTNIIIAIAWFGVNLLSVGLHSYGFTEGAAFSFFAFCALELVFAAGAYGFIRLQNENFPKAFLRQQ